MKITMLSDTHDKHEHLLLTGGDVLLHAGDATISGTKQQLTNFVLWLSKQDYKHKIWIAGNHDWGMETDQAAYDRWVGHRGRELKELHPIREHILKLCSDLGVTYLANSGVTIDGVNIWGSPDQPAFCGWGFNRTNTELTEHWKTIPDNTNILITHAPAYGILDALENGDMVGDVPLMKRLNTLPNLNLHLCGHIHPSYGMLEVGPVKHYNGSILNDFYQIENQPITIDY
jgi:hypothetical protein